VDPKQVILFDKINSSVKTRIDCWRIKNGQD